MVALSSLGRIREAAWRSYPNLTVLVTCKFKLVTKLVITNLLWSVPDISASKAGKQ
jgi:hypothetical protein